METKIRFYCAGCSRAVSAPAAFAGGKANCKHCGHSLTIPLASTRPATGTAPAAREREGRSAEAVETHGATAEAAEAPGLWSGPGARAAVAAASARAGEADGDGKGDAPRRPLDPQTAEAWKKVFRGPALPRREAAATPT